MNSAWTVLIAAIIAVGSSSAEATNNGRAARQYTTLDCTQVVELKWRESPSHSKEDENVVSKELGLEAEHIRKTIPYIYFDRSSARLIFQLAEKCDEKKVVIKTLLERVKVLSNISSTVKNNSVLAYYSLAGAPNRDDVLVRSYWWKDIDLAKDEVSVLKKNCSVRLVTSWPSDNHPLESRAHIAQVYKKLSIVHRTLLLPVLEGQYSGVDNGKGYIDLVFYRECESRFELASYIISQYAHEVALGGQGGLWPILSTE